MWTIGYCKFFCLEQRFDVIFSGGHYFTNPLPFSGCMVSLLNMDFLKKIPALLVASRFLIAIVLLADSFDNQVSVYYLPLFVWAVFSDFLDGYLCRKTQHFPERLGEFDGYADLTLYITVFYSLWRVYLEEIGKYMMILLPLLALQFLSWGYCFLKFGKITSNHTYTAKIWGITIFLAIVTVLVFHKGVLIPVMFFFGLLCIGEGIFITSIIPHWRCGIVSYKEAIKFRDKHNNGQTNKAC